MRLSGYLLFIMSIAMTGFLYAESASLIPHLKKGLTTRHRKITLSQPVVLQSEQEAVQSILPKGARIVAGDEKKNEFYILAKNEPDPVKLQSAPQLVMDKQVKQIDRAQTVLAFNQLPKVDDILSQIANKEKATRHPELQGQPITKTAQEIILAEKNGSVADLQVALDKVFSQADLQEPTTVVARQPVEVKPVTQPMPQEIKQKVVKSFRSQAVNVKRVVVKHVFLHKASVSHKLPHKLVRKTSIVRHAALSHNVKRHQWRTVRVSHLKMKKSKTHIAIAKTHAVKQVLWHQKYPVKIALHHAGLKVAHSAKMNLKKMLAVKGKHHRLDMLTVNLWPLNKQAQQSHAIARGRLAQV